MVNHTVALIKDHERHRFLESHGYAIVSAADGVEGIEFTTSLQPQLIMFDTQLPTMDGDAGAQALWHNAVLELVSIIAITSNAIPGAPLEESA